MPDNPRLRTFALLVSMMDSGGATTGMTAYTGATGGMTTPEKGGFVRSQRGTVIGLDHRLGPTSRKCGQGL